jgi:hypothetical protein
MAKKQMKDKWKYVSLFLLTIGYIWLFSFKFDLHICIKSLSLQAYFLVWLYFLLLVLNFTSVFNFSIERLFELVLVLQVIVTPLYWIVIHGPMVESKKFTSNWFISISELGAMECVCSSNSVHYDGHWLSGIEEAATK